MTKRKAPRWEWRRPPVHRSQPLLEWWFEQAFLMRGSLMVAKRAHRRKDTTTLGRMTALIKAAAEYEIRTK